MHNEMMAESRPGGLDQGADALPAPPRAGAAIEPKTTPDRYLRRRPRIGEVLIQGVLFFCGVLSILTTIGIVFELGKESLGFFSRRVWEDSNKALAAAVDAEATELPLTRSGASIQDGDLVRIQNEIMLVQTVNAQTATVVRGQQGTQTSAHAQGEALFRGRRVSLVEFFTGTQWIPQIGKFGVLPLVTATLITSLIAMLVALPLGLSVAVYLSEYASDRARRILKPILEILSGIPTVVYGFFALTFMTPLLRGFLGQNTVQIYNMASAGLVIGILILPLVSSMSEDALSAVPRSLREAAYAMGATKLEVAVKIVVPAALSGIAAAFLLAMSRAIGETMVVAIAAGQGPSFTFNPFRSAETMTGHMVRISGGDLSYDSIDYNSIFAIGLLLFIVTLMLNVISQSIVRRFREVYD
jgi:phosphate transport system permease protein